MFSVINHLSVSKHSRNGLLQAIKWLINAKCSFRCQLLDYLDTIKKTPDNINFANNNLKEDCDYFLFRYKSFVFTTVSQ